MSVLHVRIDQIVDEETKRLIDELELISGISVEGCGKKCCCILFNRPTIRMAEPKSRFR